MTDIVERLTRAADLLETGQYDIINTSLVKEAAAEIERLRAASQWQPIETAPKDGTKVLVWRPYEDKDHEAHCGVDRWSDVSVLWWNSRRYQQPTHWQPLPSPPTQEGGG